MFRPNNCRFLHLINFILITKFLQSDQHDFFKVFQNSSLEITQFNHKILISHISSSLLRCVSYCKKENLCEFAVHNIKNRSACYLSYTRLKDFRSLTGSGPIHFYIKKRKFGDLVETFQPASYVWYLKLLSNGLLACGCENGNIILLDTYRNSQVISINLFTAKVRVIKELSNGDIIAGSAIGELFIIDLQTGTVNRRLNGHNSYVLGIVELNSSHILSGGYDNKLILWDLVNNQSKEVIENYYVYELFLLDDGKVAAAYFDTVVKIFDPFEYVSPISSRQFIPLVGDNNVMYRFELINNTLLACAAGSHDVLIWDLKTYTRVFTLKGHKNAVFSLKKINEELLASGSFDNTIIIWNIKTGKLVQTLFVDVSDIYSLEMTDNGYLVSSTKYGSLNYFFIDYD